MMANLHNLPNDIPLEDLASFSRAKSLRDHQQSAWQNALKALHKYYKDFGANKSRLFHGFILCVLVMASVLTACTAANAPLEMTPTPSGQVVITGWFTTVWNGEAHYSITDAQGQTTSLLLEDEVAKPLGGPLELDRKRVTIMGEVVSGSPRIVRVLSVQFAEPE
jgi:hypothetical protein